MNDGSGRTSESGSFPGWVTPAIIVLGIVALVGVWGGWMARTYAQDTLQSVHSDMTAMKTKYDATIDTLKSGLAEARKDNTDLQDDLSVVTKHLSITQSQLAKARKEAQQAREEETEKLAAMDSHVQDQLATKASTDDVKAVSADVGGVRTDLDSTKNDLKMARSEMGTLIAKNHDDIETLRRLGERDYTEFTIAQKNHPEKVGPVTIELRGTNPKKSQCNLAVMLNDRRTEKRNRTVDEPIFLYARGEHRPLEIVVNEVDSNKIVGYVSVPKSVAQPATSPAAGGN